MLDVILEADFGCGGALATDVDLSGSGVGHALALEVEVFNRGVGVVHVDGDVFHAGHVGDEVTGVNHGQTVNDAVANPGQELALVAGAASTVLSADAGKFVTFLFNHLYGEVNGGAGD